MVNGGLSAPLKALVRPKPCHTQPREPEYQLKSPKTFKTFPKKDPGFHILFLIVFISSIRVVIFNIRYMYVYLNASNREIFLKLL